MLQVARPGRMVRELCGGASTGPSRPGRGGTLVSLAATAAAVICFPRPGAAAAAAAAYARPTPIPTDGLVSFWDFQEASGPFVAKLGAGRYSLEATDWNAATHTWSPGWVDRTTDTPPGQPFGPRSASIGQAQMLEVRLPPSSPPPAPQSPSP